MRNERCLYLTISPSLAGFYDVPSSTASKPASVDRPLSRDPRVRLARAQQHAIAEPQAQEVLLNSMSDGFYEVPKERRVPLIRSSLSDPADYFLGSSLSEGNYEMPASLRGSSNAFRRRKASEGEREKTRLLSPALCLNLAVRNILTCSMPMDGTHSWLTGCCHSHVL